MSKQIRFKYNDEEYTLEYSRATAQQIEKAGFSVDQVQSQPNIQIPLLIQGAFLCHHRRIKEDVLNSIVKKLGSKEELIAKLVEMYADTTQTLFDEPEEKEGNLNWEANWQNHQSLPKKKHLQVFLKEYCLTISQLA